MKSKEKRNLIILVAVGVIIIAILAIVRGNKTQTKKEETKAEGEEQTVQQLESGSKLNISEKLAERKYFADFEVSNIQLMEEDEKTNLSADIKNTSNQKTEVTSLEITFYDKEGEELTTIKEALIASIEAGEKTKLNVSTTSKCVNAYDFSIRIAE